MAPGIWTRPTALNTAAHGRYIRLRPQAFRYLKMPVPTNAHGAVGGFRGVALGTQAVDLLAMSSSSSRPSAAGVAAISRSRRQSLAWLAQVSFAVLAFVISCRQDAAYNGRTAREWIEQLASTDVSARVRAVDALGKIRPQSRQSISALARAVQDSSHVVHDAALVALARAGAPAVPILAETLDDDEPAARAGAASALARIGTAAGSARPQLIRALDDSSAVVRAAVASALAALGSSAHDAVPTLLSRVSDVDPSVRAAALRALGRIEERASLVLPAAIAGTRDSSGEVRYAALRVIQDYGLTAGSAVPALIERLADPEVVIQALAIDALASLGERARAADSSLARIATADTSASLRARARAARQAVRGQPLAQPREPTAEERCRSGDRAAGRC